MRKKAWLMMLTLLALLNTGCIFVLGIPSVTSHGKIVEIDGELYVVDVESMSLEKIDSDALLGEVLDDVTSASEED